jgi:1,4-dihydroxy-2-naphthoate octaprenyltransferase
VAGGTFRPVAFLAAFFGVTFLLIGVNLGNDYFDFRSGADPPIGVGPRPLQAGWLKPRDLLFGSIVAFVLAAALGLGVVGSSPREALYVGVAGAVLGFFYTAPPLRLGYRGLGEVVVFLALGPGAVVGTSIVASGATSLMPALAAVPIGFTVTAILHANNLRDFVTDERSGKRTLAVILGWDAAVSEYYLLIAAAMGAVVVLALAVSPFAALGLLALPLAWPLLRGRITRDLNGRRLMRDTAALNLRLALLLSLGFAISRFAR